MIQGNLTSKVGGAYFLVRQRAEELVEAHPEIADEYRDGKTLRQLAWKYDRKDYSKSQGVAINVVHKALKKLMDEDEMRELGREHIRANAVECGYLTGPANGKANYEAGIGIAAMTTEERREVGRRSAVAQGFVLYSSKLRIVDGKKMNEEDYITHLKESTELTWREITERVNDKFKHDRKWSSIRQHYHDSVRRNK